MDQNVETPQPNTPPVEIPQILTPEPTSTNSRYLPLYIILGTFMVFVITAGILLYNYQYKSSASMMKDESVRNNLYVQPTAQIVQVTLTPTPATVEEMSVDQIQIEDPTADFSSIDQAANGL